MIHIPDPTRYVYGHFDVESYRLGVFRLIGDKSELLISHLEDVFIERWSYCGLELKSGHIDYERFPDVGPETEHPLYTVCGECLSLCDEA